MQMLAEVLAPGVEHHRDPDLAPDPLGIPTEGLQGVRGRLKQEAVDHLRISLAERVELMGQGEDQMEIGHRQEFCGACLDPALLGQRLAFRAVAVAAGVITRDLRPTAITGLQMAPEGRRTAVLDGLHHATLLRAESMRTAIGLAMFSKDLRELQPPRPRLGGAGTRTRLRRRSIEVPTQEIEGRGRASPSAVAPGGSSASWS